MKSLPLAVALAALCPFAAQADQIYLYTGGPFQNVSGGYSTSDSIQGQIRLTGPVPAFRPLSDATGLLKDFYFDDGVHQSRTPADTFVCDFQLATDGAGNITDWTIFLREKIFTAGQPQYTLETYGHGTPREQAGTVEAGTYACQPGVLQTYGVRTAATAAPWAVDTDHIFYDGFDGG